MQASKGRRKRRGGSSILSSPALRSSAQKESTEVTDCEPEEQASTVDLSSTTEVYPPKTSVATGHSGPVPEIEIKLESSDEEDEKCRQVFRAPMLLRDFMQEEVEKAKDDTVSRCSGTWGNGLCVQDEQSPSEMEDAVKEQNNPGSNSSKLSGGRGRKSTSEVWHFFCLEPTNVNLANCGLCGVSISRGKHGSYLTTAPLRRHLEAKHPVEWGQRDKMNQDSTESAGGEEEEALEGHEEDNEQEERFHSMYEAQHQMVHFSSASLAPSEVQEPPGIYFSSDSSVEMEEEEEKDSIGSLGTELLQECQAERGGERRGSRTPKGRGRGAKGFNRYTRKTREVGKSLPGMSEAESPDTGSSNTPSHPLVPPGTKRRKSTSAVWQFFYIDHNNICRAICTLCEASVSRGKQGGHFGTSALMRHLEGKHPLEWAKGRLTKSTRANEADAEDEEEQEDEQLDEIFPASPAYNALDSLCCEPPSQASHLSLAMLTTEVQSPPPPSEAGDGELALKRKRKQNESATTTLSVKSKLMVPEKADFNGKYTPNHPRAQSWNRSISELLCGMALPYSFISAKPFHKFMARADPRYRMPSRTFFSRKAVPQMYEAVCERVIQELKLSESPRVHITAHMWTCDPLVDYIAITAHWVVFTGDMELPNTRRHAVLCIKGFQKDPSKGCIQQALLEQMGTWLTPNSLSHGFLLSSFGLNVACAIQEANYTYIPCFAHCLNMLVMDFLRDNHQIANMLDVARKICSHFFHSAKARQTLTELQEQNNLPKHPLKQETASHWNATYYMLERLLEQQKAVHEYIGMQQIGSSDVVLTSTYWNLISTVVALLQPFEMATRELSANNASLSQVLPEVRYLHIFLKQIRGHFEILGDGSAIALVDSLSYKLSSDCGINEMFNQEEYVLATLLDPRFKGRIEAILPLGADIDHWKQVTVKKVKEIMLASSAPPQSVPSTSFTLNRPIAGAQTVKECFSDSEMESGAEKTCEGENAFGDAAAGWRRSSVVPPLIQKEKTLIEHLESVGLLASKGSGASLSTESHSACIMVEKYLHDNKTIDAREDPLVYWEKRCWLWPALTKLAVLYLSCPPSSVFSENIFSTAGGLVTKQKSTLEVEGVEYLLFLKSNLVSFPDYTPPPLIFCSENELERSGSEED
ncbi:zinc finger BED domain-containing protein 6-like [Ambystoma mexicanum]|uniref:zinc finger BED domain-containing protein 6-like n=1 Tax=Ambystoma mexicanum TaxID=8296 RepID=UPI0037E73BBD